MKYTKETLQNKQIKFTIDLSHDEWEKELDHVYEHQKSKFKVEGFRQGKAPRKVIESQYGETIFFNDGLNEAFYHYFNEVLSKEPDVKMVGNPGLDVKKLDEKGVTLVVTIDVMPEVKLGKYTGLNLERPKVEVSEKEVDDEIKRVLEKSARKVVVEREAKNGDEAVIDFTGYLNDVKFEGGEAKEYPLVLGSGSFIPGFEEQVVGMKAGEDRDIKVTFPENYQAENLQGKEVVFKIHLHHASEKQYPDLNDEFASTVSEFDTLKEYKESVKADILKKKEASAKTDFENALLEKISDNTEVDIPKSMVDEQLDEYIHGLSHQVEAYGLKFEDYVKNILKTTIEEFRNSKFDEAKKACKMQLVISELIKQEKIEPSKEEIDAEIENEAKLNGMELDEFKKTIDDHSMFHLISHLSVEKLIDFLVKNN